jgi:hypothetical protein
MKKILLLLAVVFATATISEAQIAAGKYMIGGSANFQSVSNAWQLNPSGAYFLTDDIALGGNLRIGDNGGFFTNGFFTNVGVSGRKYWSILDNTFLYGHAGVNFGVVGGGGADLILYPGVMYFFNERLAIDGALNGIGGGGIGLLLLF